MNLHQKHKILKVDDEEELKKENLTIDSFSKEFDSNIKKLTNLKNTIENQMLEIDKAYERVDNEATKSYELKREKLNKEEESLKGILKNKVIKMKESLENNLSKVNNLFKSCEKIKIGIQSFEKEEKTMIRILSYISNINKNEKEIYLLTNSLMKNLAITFNEEQSTIVYDEYYFNGITKENKDVKYIDKEIYKIEEKQEKDLAQKSLVDREEEEEEDEEFKEEKVKFGYFEEKPKEEIKFGYLKEKVKFGYIAEKPKDEYIEKK